MTFFRILAIRTDPPLTSVPVPLRSRCPSVPVPPRSRCPLGSGDPSVPGPPRSRCPLGPAAGAVPVHPRSRCPLGPGAHPGYATTSVGPPRLCHYQRGPTPVMPLPGSSHPGNRTSRLNLDARAVPEALVWSPALQIAPRTRITGSRARIPTFFSGPKFRHFSKTNSPGAPPRGVGARNFVRLRSLGLGPI